MAVTHWYGCPVHFLPGRVRVFVPGLYRNPGLARRLTAALAALPGVRRSLVSADTGHALVVYDPAALPLAAVGKALGLPARPPAAPPSRAVRRAAREALLSGAALAIVVAKRLAVGPSPLSASWRTYDLAGFVAVVASYPYLRRGIRDLVRDRRLSGDLILGGASLLLLVLRENLLGLTVLFLTSLNRVLAARVFEACREAVDRLGPDRRDWVRVMHRQGHALVPAGSLRPGDVTAFVGGDVLPVDGAVVSGTAVVDPSIITGEATPRLARAGDRLLAGTQLREGALQLRVTAKGAQTELGRIMRLVRVRGRRRHDRHIARRHEAVADRWGRLALGVAALTGLATGDWRRALAALVAAAPSTAALAAPLPLAAASAEAVRRGILLKNTGTVAAAGLVDTVLFDKTGTLTAGRPAVVQVLPVAAGWSPSQVLSVAAAAEKHAFHPYGRAIREAARHQRLVVPRGRQAEAAADEGVAAEVQRRRISVGSEAMMSRQRALNPRARLLAERLRLGGHAVVYVAADRQVIGVIGLAEQVRPEAETTVRTLRRSGITDLGLVTGDHGQTARGIADGLGLTTVWAEASPEAKLRCVTALQDRGRTVAMVGDGINDAPALAAADLGVALAHGYAVPATRAADAVIVAGDPRKVAELVSIGRQAVEVVHQNQILAGGLNVIGLGLAATGAIGPLAATIWHNITTLAVLGNSTRLTRELPRQPFWPEQSPRRGELTKE